MQQSNLPTNKDSFTLVELLVVIGILAILTAAVVIVLNPAELLKQSRDSKRTTDLANLNNAIKILLTQNPDVNLGAASTVYVSLADSSSTCGSYSLPSLPAGWKYQCATAANYQKIDGAGWIPVNFSSTSNVASLPTLPVDPQNAGVYYYSYVAGGSWELMGLFESEKYAAKAQNDAGADPERLEVGSNLSLWKNAYGLAAYWPMDEGSGTTTQDSTGNGKTGTLMNGPTWQAGSNCKIGGCLLLDGSDDYVTTLYGQGINPSTSPQTLMAWAKPLTTASDRMVMGTNHAGTDRMYVGYLGGSKKWDMGIQTSSWSAGGATTQADTNWTHVALSMDGYSAKLYINGSLSFSKSYSSYAFLNNLEFGTLYGGGYPFFGYVDDARAYNRALTAAEIQAIYNATK